MTGRVVSDWIAENYGWYTLDDVDWKMLEHNLECSINVLENLDKFPKANIKALEKNVDELSLFLCCHPDYTDYVFRTAAGVKS